MPLIKKINYILDKNYQDIVLFKDYFIRKLKWDNAQYECIKEDSLSLSEESYKLIEEFDEEKFWLLADKIESLYIFIDKEIKLNFDELSMVNKEEFYKYYIRLNGLVTDIISLRKTHKKHYKDSSISTIEKL